MLAMRASRPNPMAERASRNDRIPRANPMKDGIGMFWGCGIIFLLGFLSRGSLAMINTLIKDV